MTKQEAKDRLIAAALRVAYSERGGLDNENAGEELELAGDIFEEAVDSYVAARIAARADGELEGGPEE